MARIKFGLQPSGLGKRLAEASFKSGLVSLYHEIRQDGSSFGRDLTTRVNDYKIQDEELGVNGTVREVAKSHGLEKELDAYVRRNVVGGIKGKLAYLLDLTTSIKDGLEDITEAAELAATAGAAIPTAGAGAVVVQIGSKTITVPLYIATQTAYTLLAGLLGYASGTYTFTGQGTKNYLADSALGYIGAIGSNVPVLGSLLEIGTNLDNKRPRIAEAASRRTETWLLNRIREKKGLPLLNVQEKDLEYIVRAGASKIHNLANEQRLKPLANYGTTAKTPPTIPIYGADVGSRTPYQTLKAA